VKYYFVYCRQEPIFNQFLPVLFCNKFCLIFAANIMYNLVFIYAFVCANTLGAIVLKPRFKIDVVIMII
ncbi:MAG: hypothetical protein ACK56F_01830, partial [bacterium]